MASRWSRFIFQLPLTSGRRPGAARAHRCGRRRPGALGAAAQRGQARQVAELEQLERGAAAGGDEADPVARGRGRRRRRRCRRRPPPCSPAQAATASATPAVPALNRCVLEDAHGAVPQHRARPRRCTRRRRPPSRARCRGPASRRGRRPRPCGPRPPCSRSRRPRRAPGPRCRSGGGSACPTRSSARHSSIRSRSTSEPPMSWPWAARKVKAIPPPDHQGVDVVRGAP